MFASVSRGLFEKVNEVGRAQFAEGYEGFGTSIYRLLEDLLGKPAQDSVSENESRKIERWGELDSALLWNSRRNHVDDKAPPLG